MKRSIYDNPVPSVYVPKPRMTMPHIIGTLEALRCIAKPTSKGPRMSRLEMQTLARVALRTAGIKEF